MVGVPRTRGRRGFTLIEVLLALVITIMVMSALATIYFTLSMAWIQSKQDDAELEHRNSVYAFLKQEISVKALLPNESKVAVDHTITWSRLPEAGNYDPEYLSWMMLRPPAFLKNGSWTDHLSIRVYLKFDSRKGLSIVWHPEDENIERMNIQNYDVEDFIYEFPLSKWVSEVEFCFYDSETDQWEEFTANQNLDTERWGVPDAMILREEEPEELETVFYVGKGASDS